MLVEGDKAPEIELDTDGGKQLRLSELKGRTVVVYFYPKDDTSGCTKEAIDFTALVGEFSKNNAEVVGISPDTVQKHDKFKAKHDLDVQLAADTEKVAANAYGVWVKKSMYGREYMGVERSTFVIAPDGSIAKIWRKVKVPGHAEDVLETVQSLRE